MNEGAEKKTVDPDAALAEMDDLTRREPVSKVHLSVDSSKVHGDKLEHTFGEEASQREQEARVAQAPPESSAENEPGIPEQKSSAGTVSNALPPPD